MIFAIESVDQDKYPELIDQMLRMRAEVFSGRLGWDVCVENGREIDRFDAEDPLYLLSLDERSGQLRGAVRLLPTTGPNMLRDVFSVLMPGGGVESPLIWESSRFAVNPRIFETKERAEANRTVNRTTVELLCGMVEVARQAGIQHIVSVILQSPKLWGIGIQNTALFEFSIDITNWHTKTRTRFNPTLWRIVRFNSNPHLD